MAINQQNYREGGCAHCARTGSNWTMHVGLRHVARTFALTMQVRRYTYLLNHARQGHGGLFAHMACLGPVIPVVSVCVAEVLAVPAAARGWLWFQIGNMDSV